MTALKNKINQIKYTEDIAEKFFKKRDLKDILTKTYKNVYPPNLKDLYYIFNVIIKLKRINTLEFGCGFSTLIISKALKENQKKYKKINFANLGLKNTFQHSVVDDQKKYIKISKKRNLDYFKSKKLNENFLYSKCRMTTFNNQICSEYQKLPNIVPDFIYLDGPDLDRLEGNTCGINLSKNNNFTPMACDILKIENLFLPGTLIMIDGRGQNASFLRHNLIRKWVFYYNAFSDQHFFYLDEVSVGKKNTDLLNFYNS